MRDTFRDPTNSLNLPFKALKNMGNLWKHTAYLRFFLHFSARDEKACADRHALGSRIFIDFVRTLVIALCKNPSDCMNILMLEV